jgi:hypothetical protein
VRPRSGPRPGRQRRDHAQATGLTADCTELNIDLENRSLAATRPTFGGSLLCTIQTLNYRPQMATVRPRVMQLPERDTTRRAHHRTAPGAGRNQHRHQGAGVHPRRPAEQGATAYADIIVSGGRGLKNAENFQLVWDLAWCWAPRSAPRDRGPGRLGRPRPSGRADRQDGSAQALHRRRNLGRGPAPRRHGGSDVIIAINSDPNAPIFDFATYAIVGNAMQILPALTEAFSSTWPWPRCAQVDAKRSRKCAQKFDVIVIGAGPSGNAAAYTAAKAGLKVLQIERGEYPGSKNVQGAILYSDALEKIIPDFRDDAPLERHIIEQRLWMLDDDSFVGSHYRSTASTSRPTTATRSSARNSTNGSPSKVQEAGALLICETTVTGPASWTATASSASQTDRLGGSVFADIVILADGVNSMLAKRRAFAPN